MLHAIDRASSEHGSLSKYLKLATQDLRSHFLGHFLLALNGDIPLLLSVLPDDDGQFWSSAMNSTYFLKPFNGL
jgi:hypothetical protein